MNLEKHRLEAASELVFARIPEQNLPAFMQKRWKRAFAKARQKLVEQPYYSWQNNRLMLVSLPNANETACKFYEASAKECRRFDQNGLCQAFYEGFPCWHRAAFLLLQIYHGECEQPLCV